MNHPDRFLDMNIPGVTENWLLTDVVGEDYISSPYYFKLTVLCDNHDLPLRDLLEKPITFRIGHLDSRFQTFHGLLYGLARESKTVAGMTEYTLWVHPRLRWLADKKDSYVYAVKQPQTIPEIVTEILKREGLLDYRFALVNDYPRLSLSVQYDESAFNILHRLLSQAGIYYYFERTADKETLVLTDNLLPSSIEPAQYSDDTHTAPHLFHWQARLGTSSVAIKGQAYDFRSPSTIVKSEQTLSKTAIPSEMRHGIHRHHDTPFHANTASLDAQAKPRLSASQRSTNRVQAKGTYHHWQAGTMFSLSSSTQPKLSGDYCVSHIAHVARDTAHLPSQSTTESQHYHNVFYAHPSHLSLMGQAEGHRLLPELGVKPIVIETPQLSGVYTATTTGPKGTTVYTDKYNRVKVQFDWDKHGQYDENSFAWVRVKQVSASDGFGVQVTPRVGQRVLACFNHGDPHNPMIIGMLAQDKAPFSPKSTPTQLGWQSNSLDPQANQQAIAGHQLRFDDNVKHPTVNLHSYRDMDITAHGEHKTTVGKNMTSTVTQGNYLQQTEKDLHLYSDKGIHLINGQSRMSITPTDITIESDEIGFNGPKPADNTNAAKTKAPPHYWCRVTCAGWPKLSFNNLTMSTLELNDNTGQPTITASHQAALSANGIAAFQFNDKLPNRVHIDNAAIIGLNKKALVYPYQTVKLTSSMWQKATRKALPQVQWKPEDKQLTLDILPPPVIVNVYNKAQILTDDQLHSFKATNNNVTVFIHGYNVPIGEWPPAVESMRLVEKKSLAAFGLTSDVENELQVTFKGQRTFATDIPTLLEAFAQNASDKVQREQLRESFPKNSDGDTVLNGTGAHNWALEMEYQLNVATTQFKGEDKWQHYTRCCHVFWDGTVDNATDFVETMSSADIAGTRLVKLLSQLLQAGLEVNIIAHSLGNRVLLSALEQLPDDVPAVSHIFMWEAAVAANALSPDAKPTQPDDVNRPFPKASAKVKKITVLSNTNDGVLLLPYWVAGYVQLPFSSLQDVLLDWLYQQLVAMAKRNPQGSTAMLGELASDWVRFKHDGELPSDWNYQTLVNTIKQRYPDAAHQRLAQLLNNVLFRDCLGKWANGLLVKNTENDDAKARYWFSQARQALDKLQHQRQRQGLSRFMMALGLEGADPHKKDPAIQKMIKENKIISAPMNHYAAGHSYMKNPNPDVMKYGYQRYIMGQSYGMKKFGRYDPKLFPKQDSQ